MGTVEILITLIFLIICAYKDLKNREVNIILCIIVGVVGILYGLFIKEVGIWKIICRILPGIFLYIISILTREEIGIGDALIIETIGIYNGIKNTIIIFVNALFITVVVGVIFLKIKKSNLKYRLPFVPFILLSFITIYV